MDAWNLMGIKFKKQTLPERWTVKIKGLLAYNPLFE